jgi:hypothetical protein
MLIAHFRMADNFCVWLESCLARFPASKDKQITVVGVIGNSSPTQKELPELIIRHLFGSICVFRGETSSQPNVSSLDGAVVRVLERYYF